MTTKSIKHGKDVPTAGDREDLVSIDLDLSDTELDQLKEMVLRGGFISVEELIRDIFRRELAGEGPFLLDLSKRPGKKNSKVTKKPAVKKAVSKKKIAKVKTKKK